MIGKPWTVPGLGLEMEHVEAGSFMMGSEDGKDDERPVHEVRITRPFWMGKYEVTERECVEVDGVRRYDWLERSGFPMTRVSWDRAATFCRLLTGREGGAGRLPAGYEFRLPTEAEWEYAARGGPASRNAEYAGGNDLDEVAWHWRNSGGQPHEVGTMKATELGLHDMSGNVWEWCLDWYDDGYYGTSPPADPSGPPTATNRVIRGGSHSLSENDYRVASREENYPASASRGIGFRVVLAPAIKPPAPDPAP